MKKLFLLAASFAALMLSGADFTLAIPAGKPGETAVWFIGLDAFKVKPGSLKLTAPDGKAIPFSLDYRYSYIPKKGEYVRPADGFYSKWISSDLHSLKQLGYLSFRNPESRGNCTLSFDCGNEQLQPQPNPAVRAWWVELLTDPMFKAKLGRPLYTLTGKKQTKEGYKSIPGGGVAFAVMSDYKGYLGMSGMFLYPPAFQFDDRLIGRRFDGAVEAEMPKNANGNFSIPLCNGGPGSKNVINCYFKAPDSKRFIVYVAGLVKEFPPLWVNGKPGRCSISITAPGKLYELHLQSPPFAGGLRMTAPGSLLYSGDLLRCRIAGAARSQMQKVELQSNKGMIPAEMEIPAGYTADPHLELLDMKGKVLSSSDTTELKIPQVKKGTYQLKMELRGDGGILIFREVRNVSVMDSPWGK